MRARCMGYGTCCHPLLLAYLIAVLLPVPQILPREEKMAEFVDKFKNFHEAFMAEFQ
jgi:hypothetical protein